MVACKMEAQLENTHTHCIHFFACLAPICMVNKISASELIRKFIKSALLVGLL